MSLQVRALLSPIPQGVLQCEWSGRLCPILRQRDWLLCLSSSVIIQELLQGRECDGGLNPGASPREVAPVLSAKDSPLEKM